MRRDGAQEQPGIRELVLVRRLLEQLDDLRVRRRFLLRRARHLQRSQHVVVADHQAIGVRELRVDQLMPEDDVAQLVREHHRERRLVGEHVDETAAQHDRVADGERLERGREQDACVHLRLELDVVGDEEVVDDRLENLLDVA